MPTATSIVPLGAGEVEAALSRADLLRWAATRSAVRPPDSFDECEAGEAVAHAQDLHPAAIAGGEARTGT